MAIVPDTKDWSRVLREPCAECGFDAAAVEFDDIAPRIRVCVAGLGPVLRGADAADRPNDHTWSAVEYAAHLRDVFGVFTARLETMLAQDHPTFESWDADEAAVAGRYDELAAGPVAEELAAAGERAADAFGGVPAAQRARSGRRGDGMAFTVDSLARYLLHEAVHHLADVRR